MKRGTVRFTLEDRTLRAMMAMYCAGKHAPGNGLCPDCAGLLAYAMERLERCRFGKDKPNCLDCPVHCYKPECRARIRDVMRFAGPRMLGRHPLLALLHILRGRRRPRATARSAAA